MVLERWQKGVVTDWERFKREARVRVQVEIERFPTVVSYPIELEIFCFWKPNDKKGPLPEIPGAIFHFEGIINSAPELLRFLQTDLDRHEIPEKPDYGIEYYWHVYENGYHDKMKELEAKWPGHPWRCGSSWIDFRKELDLKLGRPS